MFLHLGENKVVFNQDLIGFFNYDLVNKSRDSSQFLELVSNGQKLEKIGEEKNVKSFIITTDKVFLSPISTITLQKRALQRI
ncbi:MAG TPA: DUF370 domain-containing protein [Clostridia bacterium]|nr:DUF370 domain-containing protein [Clostridia bacterium]